MMMSAPTEKTSFPPTREQQRVIRTATGGDDLKIAAYAGAGKTTTLRLVAHALGDRHGAYLAFNKTIATEAAAVFPKHVECRTIHSFAFRALEVPRRFPGKLGRRTMPSDIARLLSLPADGIRGRDQLNVVRAMRATLKSFEQSADQEIGLHHVPNQHLAAFVPSPTALPAEAEAMWDTRRWYAHFIVTGAREIWADMMRPNGMLGITHDTYLKVWQLEGAELDVDFVLVDEAQDLNPVTIAVVAQQKDTQRIWVGDTHQQIYAWRGAVNAMEMIDAPEYHITQSFRWGPAIARLANAIIEVKGPLVHPVRGYEKKMTTFGVPSEPFTYITRGNASIFSRALACAEADIKFCVVGSIEPALRQMESAYALYAGRRHQITDQEFRIFQDWNELVTASQDDHGLAKVVERVEEYTTRIPGLLEKLRNAGEVGEDEAAQILTTTHKAKGREWDHVELANDFRSHKRDRDEGEPPRVEEVNILYVAATRAMKLLGLNRAAEELL